MNEDKIKTSLQIDKNEEGRNVLECYVLLNDKPIEKYCEFSEFIFNSKDNRDYWTKCKYPSHKQLDYSNFEPFTCSCGVSGCAGIHDGIYTKYRKRSIEWRIPRDMGYESILDKTFYSFSREQYQSEVDNLLVFLEDNSDVLLYDDQDTGYWDDDKEEWFEEVNYIKLGEKYKWVFDNS